MSSALAVKPAALPLGDQRPRVFCAPPSVASSGQDAIDIARIAGLILDPWQEYVLEAGLAERADGTWAASEVALIVARQNGKSAVLEALCLYALFVAGDKVTLYSAHEFKTAKKQFERVEQLINNTPQLRSRLKKIFRNPAEFGFELRTGERLYFVARSGGSGRGYTANRVIYDEAYKLDETSLGAMQPTMKTVKNKQSWYASSAPWESSQKLHQLRKNAIDQASTRLTYLEWSAADDLTGADVLDASRNLHDGRFWAWSAAANPGLGIRIDHDAMLDDLESMGPRMFLREDLGVPDPEVGAGVFTEGIWAACQDRRSQIDGKLTFAVDMRLDRSATTIAVAGRRKDGLIHVEVVDHREGTDWVIPRLQDLSRRWREGALILDPGGPAGSLLRDLKDARIEPKLSSTRDFAQACGAFYDAVTTRQLRHLGQTDFDIAVTNSRKRRIGDLWAWDRAGEADTSPLAAASLAFWGVSTRKARFRAVNLAEALAAAEQEA